jgi:hypothetical protein
MLTLSPTSSPRTERTQDKLLVRLKDPQVWVCAIAAFTLIGLGSGLLDPADPSTPSQQIASAESSAR